MKQEGKHPIIVDAGDLLFERKVIQDRHEESWPYKARQMLKGYEMLGVEAINVGEFDLAAGVDFLKELAHNTDIPFLSANLRDAETGELIFQPYLIEKRGPFQVGIIGLTSDVPKAASELKVDDFIEIGRATMAELKDKTDIMVVLVNVDTRQMEQVRKQFADADFIFPSRSTARTRPEQVQPVDGPKLYSSSIEGKYVALVDLTITNLDSPFVDVGVHKKRYKDLQRRLDNLRRGRDENRSLQELYADNPNILRIVKRYEAQMEAAQKALQHERVNQLSYDLVPLGKKMDDDPQMLRFVDDVLATAKKMDAEAVYTNGPVRNLGKVKEK